MTRVNMALRNRTYIGEFDFNPKTNKFFNLIYGFKIAFVRKSLQ